MKKIIYKVLVFIVLSNNGYCGIIGPSNFEDCVLENIKNVKTELGIKSVHSMCRGKFPDKSNDKLLNEIPQNEIPKLCLLFWNSLKTKRLQNEPKDWGQNYSRHQVSRFGMPVAEVFTPKEFILDKESKLLMINQVEIYCK